MWIAVVTLLKALNRIATAAGRTSSGILLTIVICGCSASGTSFGSSFGPPSPLLQEASRGASTTFEIFIPKRANRAISGSSKSASIGIKNGPPVIANLTARTPGCSKSPDGVRCSVSSRAAPGSDTFEVSIFDGLNATGNKLSTADVTQQIVAGQKNRVNVTLDGITARIVLALQAAPPPEGKKTSIGVSVMAEDAKGSIIVGPGNYATPISLADRDPSGTTKLSATRVTAPSTHVTLAYTGGKLSSAGHNAHITASASGVRPIRISDVYFVTAQDQWVTWGKSPYRNSYNPTETTLTQSNVSGLTLLWKTKVGGVVTGEPVIVANVNGTSQGTVDVLYVGDAHGHLYAMNAGTGAVLWTQTVATETINGSSSDPAQQGCFDQPGGIYGIGGSPVADPALNTVYTVDGMGYLYGFDLATGVQSLRTGPMWAYDASDNNFNITNDYGALNEDVVHHVIYVPGGAHCGNENYGGIQQYNLKTGAISHWYSMGGPPNTYGGIWGPGGVVVSPTEATTPSSDSVYFATAYGPTPAQPGQYPYSIVRLKENMTVKSASVDPIHAAFPGDLDFGDTPLVFAPSAGSGCHIPMLLAAESKNGVLYLLKASNLSAGPIQTIQLGTYSTDGENLGTAAYDPTRNLVYINNGSNSSSLHIKHGLVAFTLSSDCRLKFAWQAVVGPNGEADGPPSPPTVANGVVYYADGPGTNCTPVGNGGCGASPADFNAYNADSGALLFHTTVPGPLFTPPVVVNGLVYLTSWDGQGPGIVYCFGLAKP
jgi:outer membrane protein assembly factor BamB